MVENTISPIQILSFFWGPPLSSLIAFQFSSHHNRDKLQDLHGRAHIRQYFVLGAFRVRCVVFYGKRALYRAFRTHINPLKHLKSINLNQDRV
jgi:hypothetical protein